MLIWHLFTICALCSYTVQCTNVNSVVQICKYFSVNVEKMYRLHIFLNSCTVFFYNYNIYVKDIC